MGRPAKLGRKNWATPIYVKVGNKTLRWLDKERGLTSRSAFVRQLLEETQNKTTTG